MKMRKAIILWIARVLRVNVDSLVIRPKLTNDERAESLLLAKTEILEVCKKYNVDIAGKNTLEIWVNHLQRHDSGDLTIKGILLFEDKFRFLGV